MEDIHYFISGAHWKIVEGSEQVVSLYDPELNVVHYFKPERRSVDAALDEGPVSFEHLTETKKVLGRECKGIRQTSEGMTFVEFYDPTLFVDPKLYARHRHGHWGASLAQKGGALGLWSSIELPEGDVVSEAIRIEPRTFEPSFWSIAETER